MISALSSTYRNIIVLVYLWLELFLSSLSIFALSSIVSRSLLYLVFESKMQLIFPCLMLKVVGLSHFQLFSSSTFCFTLSFMMF